jgi:hypothetical protein
MIKPDPREILWYDISNLLSMEPDMIPHYWTIIIDKMRLLDDNVPRPVCLVCNSSLDIFEHEGKLICGEGYTFARKFTPEQGYIIENLKQKLGMPHTIGFETLHESIARILRWIFDITEEPTGYRFDLFDLETVLFQVMGDSMFETKWGDITKNNIKKYFYQLKKPLLGRMMELRQEIRFSSMMRVPAISVR